jgi:hypothetical protein
MTTTIVAFVLAMYQPPIVKPCSPRLLKVAPKCTVTITLSTLEIR